MEAAIDPAALHPLFARQAPLVLGAWLYRLRPASLARPPPLDRPDLCGIGGWLGLVALGVILRPVLLLYSAWGGLRLIGHQSVWSAMTDPESGSRIPGIAALAFGENFFALLFLAWAVVLVPQFFRRKASLPVALTALLLAETVWAIAHACWVEQIPLPSASAGMNDEVRGVMRMLVASFVWVPYLFLSRRVRRTFRN